MNDGIRWLTLLTGIVCATVVVAADYRAPRAPGSKHPDLNGIWQALNEANWDVERHMARASLQLRDGPMGPVPAIPVLRMGAVAAVPPGIGVIAGGGRIPYTEAGLKQKQANQADWINRDPEVKCYLPGVPRATYMPHPFQIFQNDQALFIAYQYAGAVREIYLDDPGEAPADSWMGQSAGHWEKDTLVVEVTGQLADTWFDRAGNHHSDQLKVTERYTPMSANHLWYEARIEDPATFTEAWTIAMPLYRRMEPDARLMDFKCVEFVEELLYGEFRRQPLPR
ncbi:MAG: hypothetical protein H6993_07815 [Pseudomonadales bacterium]|nr:hypothetical protein [Pseudomonadales bacterium]MCP5183854.1 hypothetical protein [Pseudomonadales bacterium]